MMSKEGFCLVALPGSKNVHKFSNDELESNQILLAPFQSFGNKNVSIPVANAFDSSPLTEQLQIRPNEPVIDRSAYIQSVKKAISRLLPEGLSKVVLARNEVIDVPADFDPVNFFYRVCAQYPHAFRYLLWHPDTGMWLGASPELLLEVRGDTIRTMSLAGTLFEPSGNWTEKEFREHDIVTRYIADKLRTIPVRELTIEGTQTVDAGNIKHLRTNISAKMAEPEVDELVRQLHPTPAIAGFPTEEALAFIRENETLVRGYYAGYVGISGPRSLQLFVNLRCMRIYSDCLEFYSGAGITSDSVPEREWEETERKIATLKDCLSEPA